SGAEVTQRGWVNWYGRRCVRNGSVTKPSRFAWLRRIRQASRSKPAECIRTDISGETGRLTFAKRERYRTSPLIAASQRSKHVGDRHPFSIVGIHDTCADTTITPDNEAGRNSNHPGAFALKLWKVASAFHQFLQLGAHPYRKIQG